MGPAEIILLIVVVALAVIGLGVLALWGGRATPDLLAPARGCIGGVALGVVLVGVVVLLVMR